MYDCAVEKYSYDRYLGKQKTCFVKNFVGKSRRFRNQYLKEKEGERVRMREI